MTSKRGQEETHVTFICLFAINGRLNHGVQPYFPVPYGIDMSSSLPANPSNKKSRFFFTFQLRCAKIIGPAGGARYIVLLKLYLN
jgi:hypothetical protein